MNSKRFDVVVIGDGPAGSTVALQLVKLGYLVALIGLPLINKKFFGETLSPNIKNSLIQLGLWKDFLNDGHLPSTGNLSSWGDIEMSETNFIFHPDMYGWHIDRRKFDSMFLNAAIRQGVVYLINGLVDAQLSEHGIWNLKMRSYNSSSLEIVSSDFLIDATGRRGLLASFQNIKRFEFDNLIGFVLFLRLTNGQDDDSITLIEAVPDGWWYSALLPDNTRVVSFFTNRNLPVAKQAVLYSGWNSLMHRTKHIKKIIEKNNYCLLYGPFARISSSSILHKFVGHRWLTVGDASITFDPISSNGILTAIINSMTAANLVASHLDTKNTNFDLYENTLITDFYIYLLKR